MTMVQPGFLMSIIFERIERPMWFKRALPDGRIVRYNKAYLSPEEFF